MTHQNTVDINKREREEKKNLIRRMRPSKRQINQESLNDRVSSHETRKSHQQGESRMRNTALKRKTSVYLDENNMPKIQGLQRKYNLSLNRVVNMCLNKYLDEMRIWI